MVPWSALMWPALAATGFVFVASSVIHMVLQLHRPDYGKLANEDEVRAAVGRGSPAPGQYVVPHASDGKAMASPEFCAKMEAGPNLLVYVGPRGVPKMPAFLGRWIAYTLVVSLVVGYIARATLAPGANYLQVFQVVGVSAWLAYSWQGPSDWIWKFKPTSVVLRGMFDGLLYAAVTAGAYGWLWPKA